MGDPRVSVLFNEPKLLKWRSSISHTARVARFSALQRAEIAEIPASKDDALNLLGFSALQRAEIAEIVCPPSAPHAPARVSVLFNEPKLLKYPVLHARHINDTGFSALQRAEIAEIDAVQLEEASLLRFSALQRAEIAEITWSHWQKRVTTYVSVLFNEPKLLKCSRQPRPTVRV